MNIINLTQHPATPTQKGVVDMQGSDLLTLKRLLTFDDLPTLEDIEYRADAIADLAVMLDEEDDFPSAMMGGAPFLMPALTQSLKDRGIRPLFAFSKRESIETVSDDGSVKKTTVFNHIGFVEA